MRVLLTPQASAASNAPHPTLHYAYAPPALSQPQLKCLQGSAAPYSPRNIALETRMYCVYPGVACHLEILMHPLTCTTTQLLAFTFTHAFLSAGCATVAEVRKRGDDFWGEFEFYLSDLVVGCVLDCVLVGLLAPAAVIGAKPKTKPSGKHRAYLFACWCLIVNPVATPLAATPLAVRHTSLHGALPEPMWQVSTSMLSL